MSKNRDPKKCLKRPGTTQSPSAAFPVQTHTPCKPSDCRRNTTNTHTHTHTQHNTHMSTTFRLLVPLAFLLANSPLTRTHTGAPIAPIPLIANSIPPHADADTSANQRLRLATTALLFPANLATFVASAKPFDPDGPELAAVNLQQLWDTAIEKATARMASVDGMAHPEILITGSWCLVFGSILSFLLRRVHVVQLFGLAMLGAYMFQNGVRHPRVVRARRPIHPVPTPRADPRLSPHTLRSSSPRCNSAPWWRQSWGTSASPSRRRVPMRLRPWPRRVKTAARRRRRQSRACGTILAEPHTGQACPKRHWPIWQSVAPRVRILIVSVQGSVKADSPASIRVRRVASA